MQRFSLLSSSLLHAEPPSSPADSAKDEPNDIDAVILLPNNFQQQVDHGFEPAVELEEMLVTRSPEEIFAAEDDADWNEWTEFFGRTRESDGRRKGLVEIILWLPMRANIKKRRKKSTHWRRGWSDFNSRTRLALRALLRRAFVK